jgi:hypothetical protein
MNFTQVLFKGLNTPTSKEVINLETLRQATKVVVKSYFNDWMDKDRMDQIDKYYNLLLLWEKSHNSTLAMLRRVDMLRLHYLRYIAGNPLMDTDKIRLKSAGLPSCLKFLRLECKEANEVRFNLTLLTATRAITLDGIPDVQVITQSAESTVNPKLARFVDVCLEDLKKAGMSVPPCP